jgi:hypothetical protein
MVSVGELAANGEINSADRVGDRTLLSVGGLLAGIGGLGHQSLLHLCLELSSLGESFTALRSKVLLLSNHYL